MIFIQCKYLIDICDQFHRHNMGFGHCQCIIFQRDGMFIERASVCTQYIHQVTSIYSANIPSVQSIYLVYTLVFILVILCIYSYIPIFPCTKFNFMDPQSSLHVNINAKIGVVVWPTSIAFNLFIASVHTSIFTSVYTSIYTGVYTWYIHRCIHLVYIMHIPVYRLVYTHQCIYQYIHWYIHYIYITSV